MRDPTQRDSSPAVPPPPEVWARSLDAEAMRRRIGARLFGETPAPTYLGRFRVLRTLGEGALGVLYAAEDERLRRVVALRAIREDLLTDDEVRARITGEARALARLADPNVVRLYEVVTSPEAMFLVMEYVEGATLLQWARAERRRVDELLVVFAAAARGLAAAHRAGVVHRDIRADNMLIGEDGRVRIVDFALVRVTERGSAAEVDARGDHFSFCATLYEIFYGERPAVDLRTLPSRPRVPARIRRMLARGLSARAAERLGSMDEVAAILERRGRSLLVGLVVAVLLAGLVAWLFSG